MHNVPSLGVIYKLFKVRLIARMQSWMNRFLLNILYRKVPMLMLLLIDQIFRIVLNVGNTFRR